MHAFDVLPLGDTALLLRATAEVDASFLLQLREQIVAAGIARVSDIVIGYASLAVFGDALLIDAMRSRIITLLSTGCEFEGAKAVAPLIEIPVCYDAEFAPDLAEIAQRCGLDMEEVIRLHASGDYTVRCVGFTPGFPYLSGLPVALATPRRATPRTTVPAGSVAIGGRQTGIYPSASPGGWNIIGRTPLQLFDPRREPAALLRAGDQVRFRAISRDEFAAA